MLLLICTERLHVAIALRVPKALRAGCARRRRRGGRCASPIETLAGLRREELERVAFEWAKTRGHRDDVVEQLRGRVQLALADFDHRMQLRASIDAKYPNAPWTVRREKLRQALERERKAAAAERRREREWKYLEPRAAHELERVRDRIDRRPYTTGIRSARQWAPDWVFPSRRVDGVMPRDRAPDAAPPARQTRRKLKNLRRGSLAERRDPTCGGFFKPETSTARPPAHARRAQLRVDVERAALENAAAIARHGVRRRPGGKAA